MLIIYTVVFILIDLLKLYSLMNYTNDYTQDPAKQQPDRVHKVIPII